MARKLAIILLEHDVAFYPQHIKGEQKIIADSLSRDFHLSNKKLCFTLTTLFPTQTPQGLTILPELPTEIICWVESLIDGAIIKPESLPAPTHSKVGALLDGSDTWPALGSKINSWIHSTSNPKSASCQYLLPVFAEMSMAKQCYLHCPGKPFAQHSTMFVRNSAWTEQYTQIQQC